MANFNVPAFYPDPGATVSLSAGTASTRVRVQTNGHARHLRVWNSGVNTAYIEQGGSTITATTTTSMPIPPGNIEIISCPHDYVAGITDTSTSVLFFTCGEGM